MEVDSAIFTAEGRVSTKKQRSRDCKSIEISSKLSASYKSNGIKEELTLEYIQSFFDQFASLNPSRSRPYVVAENECGVRKFVSSTIRPTQISFSELYDMYECASFLAGYILYEPLDPQIKPPRILFSPTETLSAYTGDSFDMSILLCSLLIGAGYDAYVVCGYAPRHITLKDQSMIACPMVASLNETLTKVRNKSTEDEDDVPISEINPYHPPDNTVKSSTYVADMLEKQRIESLDKFELWIPDGPIPSLSSINGEIQSDDLINGSMRVHAWVMVAAGKRDVKSTTFFEPSTGRLYTPANAPYLGVESIWNNSNFWVLNTSCMGKKISEVGKNEIEIVCICMLFVLYCTKHFQ